MTEYVRSDFTSQFYRLEDIIDRDDADALKTFLREERFILLVDEPQMQLLNDTTMNARLIERENILIREKYLRFPPGWNCLAYLTESPQSWNVDLIDFNGIAAFQLAHFLDDIRGAVQLASFSNEIRPYPVTFEIQAGDEQINVPLSYLLWPQGVRLIQPERMQSQIDEINRIASLHIPTKKPEREHDKYRQYIHIGLIYELLLANSELVNFDMTGDERLPYSDIFTLDSTRMWPIRPMGEDDVVDHSKCESFLACIEPEWSWKKFLEQKSYRQSIFNTWKEHRFVKSSLGSDSASIDPFQWGPPSLRDFTRLVIRRVMVRHVELTIFDFEETLQPNQAKLVRNLRLPRHLYEFMFFIDIPIRMNRCEPHWRSFRPTDTEKYGSGIRIERGFIPDTALSLHRSGVPHGLCFFPTSKSHDWRIDPMTHDKMI